ncbi:MAG: UDP-N-acetyl-D-glucosamine dehydrogenase, partial [Lentisphaerae bacterium]|nr:UDP-N-acetyl-D-glucosamine dehydrogenase [Lentisphaerota bacterium]
MTVLQSLLQERRAILGVIGLGYVGLPLAVEKAKAGYRVVGFDIQPQKVDMVNQGINYIGDVVDEDLATIVEAGMLTATSDFNRVAELDCVSICVPTPLDLYQ